MRALVLAVLLTATAARGDFPLNSAPPQPTTYPCSEPVIAPLGDEHVVAWSEFVRGELRVHARLLGRDGRLGDDRIVDRVPGPTYFQIAPAGSGPRAFLLATNRLYRIEHDLSGVFLGKIDATVMGFGANDDFVLVVTQAKSDTVATLLDRDGVPAGKPVPIATGLSSYTQIIVAPARGGFLLGWIDDNDRLVRTLFVTSADLLAGHVAAPVVTPSAKARQLQLAADAAGFLAVWLEPQGDFWNLMVRRFSAAGEPLSPPRMTGQFSDLASTFATHSLATAASGFVMFLTEENRDYSRKNVFLRLDSNGDVADVLNIAGDDPYASIAARGNDAFIVQRSYWGRSTLELIRIGADRVATPPEPFALATPRQRTLALYRTGTGWAVVWSENDKVLFGRFTAEGRPLDGDGIVVPAYFTTRVNVAFNGTALLVVWPAPVAYAFIPLAEPQRMIVLTLDSQVTGETTPDAVAAGGDFVVAWLQWSGGKVRARRVSGDNGEPLGSMREVLDTYNTDPTWVWAPLQTPRLAWNGMNLLLAWQQMQHWDDKNALGTAPRTIIKGDPFAMLLTPSLDPVGKPINVSQGRGSLDHTDFAGLSLSSTGGEWIVSWLRLGDFPALMSARLTALGSRRDVDDVPWSGDAVPPVAAGGFRAVGSRIEEVQFDGHVLPLGDIGPAGAMIDALVYTNTGLAVAYSIPVDDGGERAFVRVLTSRQHAAGRP